MLSTTARWIIAEDTPVTRFPAGVQVRQTVISLNLRHVAYVAVTDEGQRVVRDTRVDPLCASISALRFSADGEHLSYLAEMPDGAWCLVHDGQFGAAYDDIIPYGTSPDGRHLVYEAQRDGETYLVVDGEERGPYDFIPWEPVWSPDSRRLAYPIQDGEGMRVILDGEHGTPWMILSEMQFHPGCGELAYLAESDTQPCVVIGEQVMAVEADSLSDLVCHPTARHFAAQAYVEGGMQLVTSQGLTFPRCTLIHAAAYSPDGGHLACVMESDGWQQVVLDGVPGPGYDDIRPRSLTFSPDGTRLVYLASRQGQPVLVEHATGSITTYEAIRPDSLRFSPDSAHFVCVVQQEGRWHLLLDGQLVAPYDDLGHPVFSPDSAHLAYRTCTGNTWHVVIDDRPTSRPLPFVTDPQFAQDSQHVVYLAGEGERIGMVEVVRYA